MRYFIHILNYNLNYTLKPHLNVIDSLTILLACLGRTVRGAFYLRRQHSFCIPFIRHARVNESRILCLCRNLFCLV